MQPPKPMFTPALDGDNLQDFEGPRAAQAALNRWPALRRWRGRTALPPVTDKAPACPAQPRARSAQTHPHALLRALRERLIPPPRPTPQQKAGETPELA